MPSECQSHSQLRLCQNVTSDKLFKQQITCSLRACFSVGKDDLPLKSLAPEIFCTNPPTMAAFWICLPFAFSTFLAQHMYAGFRSFYSLCRCRLQLKHQQLRHYLQVPSDVDGAVAILVWRSMSPTTWPTHTSLAGQKISRGGTGIPGIVLEQVISHVQEVS